MDHGRVIAEGTRGELKASVGAGGVRVRVVDPARRDQAAGVLAAELGVPVHADPDPAALAARIPSTYMGECRQFERVGRPSRSCMRQAQRSGDVCRKPSGGTRRPRFPGSSTACA